MPLPSDRDALLRSVQRQSTLIAAGYGVVGLLGISGLPLYVDALIIAGIIAPLQVACMEAWLGWQARRTADVRWVRYLVWHQLWVSLLIAVFWVIFWRLDLAPYIAVLPSTLLEELAVALEPLGLTVEQYMHFVWRGGLIILLPLVTVKQTFLLLRYRRRAQALARIAKE